MNSISVDISFHISSLLDDETLRDVYVAGLIPHLSQLASNQLWWHARVETLTERQVAISERDVDWRETYWILNPKIGTINIHIGETAIFWNEQDNTTVLDILNDMFTPNTIDLCAAAAKGSVKIVAWLLRHPEVDPSTISIQGTYALHLAAENGHAEVVKLLLADSRVDPDQPHMSCTALSRACAASFKERTSSYVKIVTMLLANERVDPTYRADRALYVACDVPGDNVEIVDLLLEDGRVDPTRDRTEVLINAITLHNTNIVARLLQDPRVNVNIQEGKPLKQACMRGHTDIVNLLLSDPRTDPMIVDDSCALIVALKQDREAVVRLLLADNRVLSKIKYWDIDERIGRGNIKLRLVELVRNALVRNALARNVLAR
ncbi:Ankyrin repeat protein [uncultured virus]|nr:Ankyrin repeat protein [uncultured virus]